MPNGNGMLEGVAVLGWLRAMSLVYSLPLRLTKLNIFHNNGDKTKMKNKSQWIVYVFNINKYKSSETENGAK